MPSAASRRRTAIRCRSLCCPPDSRADLNNVPPNFNAFLNYPARHQVRRAGDARQRRARMPCAAPSSQAQNGRPRPTLVEMPGRRLQRGDSRAVRYVPTHRATHRAGPAGGRRGGRVLIAAERPVIYAGQGVHYAKAWPQLQQLAELLEAPVTTSLEGKSAFPETHPLSLGCAGRSMPRPAWTSLQNADVIFGIGCSLRAHQLRRRRCRRARRSSTRRSTRPTSTRMCPCELRADRRCGADAGRADRRGLATDSAASRADVPTRWRRRSPPVREEWLARVEAEADQRRDAASRPTA